MKKGIIILSLLFEITMAAAQGVDTDSLKNLITKTKEDTTRILLISSLCNELARYEPDSAIQLAKEGLKLANQIHYPKGEANLAIALGTALANVGDYATAIKWLTSSLVYVDTAKELDIKFRNYLELSAAYRDQGDYSEALKYSTKCVGLAEEYLQHFPRESCRFCRGIFLIAATIYLEKNQLDSARKFIDKAFSFPPTPRKGINASAFDYAGRIQAALKNYDSALQLYRQGIKGFLELKQPYKGLAKIYNSTAIVLNTMGLRDSALFYLHKSLTIAQQRKFAKEILDADLLLATIYESYEADSALYYYKQAMNARDLLYDQEKQRQISGYKFDLELQQQQAENDQAQFRNQVKIYALLGYGISLFNDWAVALAKQQSQKKRIHFTRKTKSRNRPSERKGGTNH